MRGALLTIGAALVWNHAVLAADTPADVSKSLDGLVQSFADGGQFSGSVLVAKGDQLLLDKGYGLADREASVANTPATRFRIGSVTKQFTAAAILLLEERGRIKTGDLICPLVSQCPPAWKAITFGHLLTHTSGIPSFTEFPEYNDRKGKPMTPQQLVSWFRDKPLDFEPGSEVRYSNSGYVLLGYLLEKVSGESYATFLDKYIFQPLRMKDSGYETPLAPAHATGYSKSEGSIVKAAYIDMSIPLSAGGLVSTTHDLLTWERALFGGRVLSPASLEKMTHPQHGDYACGLFVSRRFGTRVIEHSGAIDGFSAQLSYYPDDDLVIEVLGNLESMPSIFIANQLGAVLHPGLAVAKSLRTVPQKTLAEFAGTYKLESGELVTFSVEGTQPTIQVTGGPKLPAFAESDTAFFLTVVDARFEFVRDPKGRIAQIVVVQDGKKSVGRRK